VALAVSLALVVQSVRVVNLPFEVFAATLFELGVRVVAFVAPAALVVLGVEQRLAGDQLLQLGFLCHAFGWWQAACLALHRAQ
jgi:hypothetical protein